MHDVMRKRLWRKLEALPEDRLYQVLDFIEFLESKYAPGRAPEPPILQRFAERLEDGMRARSVAPRLMRGAVGLLGTAGRVLDGVADAGRGLLRELDTANRPPETRPGDTRRRAPDARATPAAGRPHLQGAQAGASAPSAQDRRRLAPGGGSGGPIGADTRAADEPPQPPVHK